jgi:hypothetical protein
MIGLLKEGRTSDNEWLWVFSRFINAFPHWEMREAAVKSISQAKNKTRQKKSWVDSGSGSWPGE